MIELKSHPDLQLFEHIEQVTSAVFALCEWHSEEVISPEIKRIVGKIIQYHDTGKATEAFQRYIQNPSSYHDDPKEKSHTPLSTLLTLLQAMGENWDPMEALLVSASVFGHHSRLPSFERLREIGSGILPKILKRQIPTLKIKALNEHCHLNIHEIDCSERPWSKVKRYLDKVVWPVIENLPIHDAVCFRLKAQLLFSLLLEADKAFLAVKKPELYLHRERKHWKLEWIEQKIGHPRNTPVNNIRQSVRDNFINSLNSIDREGIFSLTAPTGSGKTLLSSTWLFKLREKFSKIQGNVPKAIVVLPFLSVIDQTSNEYKELLKMGEEKVEGSWFLTSHSLADRKYDAETEEDAEHFFIDTWRTELVITTYDQFLMTLMEPKARYQMRFHNLCNALVVMDEVQSLPCRLWKPLEEILKSLVETGKTSILLMSATLPAIIPDAKPLIENYGKFFKKFNRYKLKFRLQDTMNIEEFGNEVLSRFNLWLREGKRVLITLNTRKSARFVRDILAENWPKEFLKIPLFFISADVTPKDRIEKINRIKEGNPCLVVSTQCIEAGVDIDMDFVIRDFAPLDNIIQIAGRCNRNGKISQQAIVEIIDLKNRNGERFSDMIYDDIHLQITRNLIEHIEEIEEKDTLDLTNKFFCLLSEKKDTGVTHLEKFAKWQRDDSVHELLRGKEKEKHTFLVLEQDPELEVEMERANSINDRWKRREAWKTLAGRIARISVDIYAKYGFRPQSIARELFGQWVLYEGYYSSDCGLRIEESEGESRIW